MTTTILVGREKSVNSVEEAKRLGLPIFVIAQTNPDHDEFDIKNITGYPSCIFIYTKDKHSDLNKLLIRSLIGSS